MTDRRDRFECMIDPCDLWTVWDNKRDEPAQSPNVALVGLGRDEAFARCRLLNMAAARSSRLGDRRELRRAAVRVLLGQAHPRPVRH
jgi:hypothetical protein